VPTLRSLVRLIDHINDGIGRTTAWVALAMVLVQFAIVVLRYIYGIGSILLQESVVYMHAFLFLIGAGYTLLRGGHVRVDIFYRNATPRAKAWVDLFGVLAFLLPVCVLLWWFSWPYVMASWHVFEGSKETSGIQAVYLLKTLILVFCLLVSAQGAALALRSLLVLADVERVRPTS